MSTANTLKLLRVASGLNQKELAEHLDVSPSYVSLIEGGQRDASIDYIRKFSRALDIPVSIILFQVEDPEEPSSPVQQAENQRLQNLFGQVVTSLAQAKSQKAAKNKE